MGWECGLEGCGSVFEDAESAIVHQATEHERCACEICGSLVPDGFLAIRHVFTEHSRAEYVRTYGATSEDVKEREAVLEEIRDTADLKRVAEQLNA